jgi:hypothetical protein
MRPPTDLHPLLRQEVGMLRDRESRRVFDVSVHVGQIAGERDSFVVRAQDLPAVDAALRIDVLSSLVAQSPADALTAWVTRPGEPAPHDLDLAWMAAASVAFGINGREADGFYAITRTGWLDVRTGERRTWKRLRL